jgi:hypothetical protein
MAAADYYLCDVCSSKCFYDANLNYEFPDKNGNDSWGKPIPKDDLIKGTGHKLDYVGDMAVICRDCAKKHEVVVREIQP